MYLKHLEVGSYSKLFKSEKLKFSSTACLWLTIGLLLLVPNSKSDVFCSHSFINFRGQFTQNI